MPTDSKVSDLTLPSWPTATSWALVTYDLLAAFEPLMTTSKGRKEKRRGDTEEKQLKDLIIFFRVFLPCFLL
jgi:hypothetical protein